MLDLSRHLPGPFLTRVLADLGADVVKVESPEGDPVRLTPPFVGAASAPFVALNHSKRAIAIDLKAEGGAELLRALAARADVVVESFRPGVLDRLGVGYAALSAVNPRLVLCSISGYGQEGPLHDAPGHDLGYLARCGALDLFGPAGAAPQVPGLQIADLGGGALPAAVGVLAALHETQRTGKGRHLDVSMSRGVLALAGMEAARRGAGWIEPRGQGALTGGLPCYRVYGTRDGRYMALAALEPKFFNDFCARAGCPELADRGLAVGEEGAEVMRQLERVFSERTQAEWIELLAGGESCCEPVRTLEEALADPAFAGAVGRSAEGLPLVMSETGFGLTPASDAATPSLGEHRRSVLRDYEVDRELVERAVRSGALPGGEVRDDAART